MPWAHATMLGSAVWLGANTVPVTAMGWSFALRDRYMIVQPFAPFGPGISRDRIRSPGLPSGSGSGET